MQVCGNLECRAECAAQFCGKLQHPLPTHAQFIGDQRPTGKQVVQCVVLLGGSLCTEVVLNGIPALRNALTYRATSILIQERSSTFVNMVLGRSHYPYESQCSTHCSRLTVLSLLTALTHITVLVHVHKAGSSLTDHCDVTAVLPVLFIHSL